MNMTEVEKERKRQREAAYDWMTREALERAGMRLDVRRAA